MQSPAIEAGKPYIVKWDATTPDYIENPKFTGVNVSNATANVETKYVDFVGTYSPVDIYTAEKTNLYLGGDNTLYYPWADGMTEYNINANRAYFQLKKGLTADDPALSRFVLNFGDGNGSADVSSAIIADGDVRAPRGWYTLDGVKLDGKPTRKGLYINNGHKVAIK